MKFFFILIFLANVKMNEYDTLELSLEKLNINPVEILGLCNNFSESELKKAYKKKAMFVHPDKNLDKDTSTEFKILGLCYNILKREINKKRIAASFWELKQRAAHTPDYQEDTMVNQDAFINKRHEILLSDINFDDFEEDNKNRETETDYSQVKKEKLFNIFKDGKFDRNKFNAVFECTNPIDSFEIQKYNPSPVYSSNKGLSMGNVTAYNGLIINTEDDFDSETGFTSVKNVKAMQKTSNQFVDEIITENQLNSYVKNQKKMTSKISKKKLVEKIKSREPVTVDSTMNFAEAQSKFYEQKISDMKKTNENNRKIIEKYGHIYGKLTLEQALK